MPRNAKVVQRTGRVQQQQFAARRPFEIRESPHRLIIEQTLGVFIGE